VIIAIDRERGPRRDRRPGAMRDVTLADLVESELMPRGLGHVLACQVLGCDVGGDR